LLDEFIAENAFTSVKWQAFQAKTEGFVRKHFSVEEARSIIGTGIWWEGWIYEPTGVTPYFSALDFTTPLLIEA